MIIGGLCWPLREQARSHILTVCILKKRGQNVGAGLLAKASPRSS